MPPTKKDLSQIKGVARKKGLTGHSDIIIRRRLVYRHEFEELLARVAFIEKKLGIKR